MVGASNFRCITNLWSAWSHAENESHLTGLVHGRRWPARRFSGTSNCYRFKQPKDSSLGQGGHTTSTPSSEGFPWRVYGAFWPHPPRNGNSNEVHTNSATETPFASVSCADLSQCPLLYPAMLSQNPGPHVCPSGNLRFLTNLWRPFLHPF
jgi:hypothetical protein